VNSIEKQSKNVSCFTCPLRTYTQMAEYYGARWKIESRFKELKQEMENQKSQY